MILLLRVLSFADFDQRAMSITVREQICFSIADFRIKEAIDFIEGCFGEC